MNHKPKIIIPLFVVLVCILTACGSRPKFTAPEIKPPADLIPGYVPEGFMLVSGFQLAGKVILTITSDNGDVSSFARMRDFDLKSPNGNDIQGVYYQSEDQSILITKSYFPGGNLDLWRTKYESYSQPCKCECIDLRLGDIPLPARFTEIQEERTIGDSHIAVLKGLNGWITVFVRGDYLLTVESGLPLEKSGITLEENLKIVASLLEG
ncbi:MAG: hypothetical protein ABIF04_08220 [Chloroflexota bacterium]